MDDIITEVHKQQSNKKHRNTNPFDLTCIFGWCRDVSKTPPTFPEPAPSTPPVETPGSQGTSSSKPPVDKCSEAMEKALKAAHDVEVGDEYFEDKNYNGALSRYRDAVEKKPGDIAIHVRVGRAYEKLKQFPQAIEAYKAAQELAGPAKWSDEAKHALARLQKDQTPGK